MRLVCGLLSFSCDIDHTGHRNPKGMMTNLIAALVAYTYFNHLSKLKRFTPKQIEELKIVLSTENTK